MFSEIRYSDNYINYSEEKGLSSYMDFIDITHLKPSVVDEFSEHINHRGVGDSKVIDK